MVIDEKIGNEVGLEAAAVYFEMVLILCTGMYREKFKGCRVKQVPNTVFISIAKLKEIIPFMSTKKIYNAVNRLVSSGYIKEANYRLSGMNTTKCYQMVER